MHSVKIGKRGDHFYAWEIELKAGNDPRWLEGLNLLDRIRNAKENAGYSSPHSLKVSSPGIQDVDLSKLM